MDTKRSLVSAIIVCYKNEIMTCGYVNNQLSKIKEIDHIIIVNNAATEDSNQLLLKGIHSSQISYSGEEVESQIVILPSLENLGFAKGNNMGTRYVDAYIHSKYLLFTNDDILINDGNVIGKLISTLELNERIGCIGPKILKPNGEIQVPGNYSSLWRRYFNYSIYPIAKRFLRKRLEKKRMLRDSSLKEGFYYIVIGCFFMIRLSDFKKVGMMDENTFLYREEEILAERLKAIDKSNYCLPAVNVTHLVGQTTGKGKRKSFNLVNKITRQSDIYYYHKYKGYPIWQIKFAQFIQLLFGKIFG